MPDGHGLRGCPVGVGPALVRVRYLLINTRHVTDHGHTFPRLRNLQEVL